VSINNVALRPLSRLKRAVAPEGRRPRRVLAGLYRGLVLDLDLQRETQLYLGLWERETHAAIRRAAGRCRWAVDVGAGRGELCLLLLKGAPSVAAVVAFEPNASEAAGLERNLGLNGLDGDRRFVMHRRTVGTGAADLPLDGIGAALSGGPGFLKIDVDGAEADVLRSGERLLRPPADGGPGVDLLVETHSAALERECLAWLGGRGFRCEVIRNARWRLLVPEQRPVEHNRWLWATNVPG
jgi:hypothetical protein